MKSIKLSALFIFTVLLLNSCETPQQYSPQTAHLHLQGWFNYDDVKIDIDGTQVYHNDTVVTNPLLSLADTDSTIQSYGTHEIKVKVNNILMLTENFDLHQTLWLGIRLDAANNTMDIIYSTEQFLYD